MKKSTKTIGHSSACGISEKSSAVSATHEARKGLTSAKKMPGHPVRKVDARSLHRILTWSVELNQRQKQLIDAAMEILANAAPAAQHKNGGRKSLKI